MKRWAQKKAIILLVIALLMAGCGLSGITATPGQNQEMTSTTVVTAELDKTSTPEATPTAVVPNRLVLWLPPQFDPGSGSQSGNLLAARLEEFKAQHPGVEIDVRLKSPSGAGGLLDALSASSAAAPLAAPSVIALTRSDLETAALKGLIDPLDGREDLITDADWYPYARQMAQIDGSLFGLPFSGDAMILVYRPSQVGELLKTGTGSEGVLSWPLLAAQTSPVIFPAANSQALLTLALYQSLGGPVADSDGRPTLDVDTLTKVFDTFTQGALNGAFPPWITSLETDAQAWQAFRDGRANLLITWTNSYLLDLPADAVAVPLSGMQGTSFTLSNGWLWVVSDPFPERRELSQELAVFLSQSDFLSSWSEASALLPTRPSALAAWKNQSLAAMLNQVALSAQVRPDLVILTSISPALHDTGLDVLKQKMSAHDAATQAAGRLIVPND